MDLKPQERFAGSTDAIDAEEMIEFGEDFQDFGLSTPGEQVVYSAIFMPKGDVETLVETSEAGDKSSAFTWLGSQETSYGEYILPSVW